MADLVRMDYQGISVSFTEEAWFNATSAAEKFGKRPVDWVRLEETQAYLKALAEALGISEPKSLIRAKRNSGTWFHPKLAVRFAQWLDMRFAAWCDMQIDGLLKGHHPHYDWKRLCHEATASLKVMNAVVQLTRQMQGKPTEFYHYANEIKLVNWALTGEHKKLDRNSLSTEDLKLLAKLEERNSVLMGCGLDKDSRKVALQQLAAEWRAHPADRPSIDADVRPSEELDLPEVHS